MHLRINQIGAFAIHSQLFINFGISYKFHTKKADQRRRTREILMFLLRQRPRQTFHRSLLNALLSRLKKPAGANTASPVPSKESSALSTSVGSPARSNSSSRALSTTESIRTASALAPRQLTRRPKETMVNACIFGEPRPASHFNRRRLLTFEPVIGSWTLFVYATECWNVL